jgi:hypothetical protein
LTKKAGGASRVSYATPEDHRTSALATQGLLDRIDWGAGEANQAKQESRTREQQIRGRKVGPKNSPPEPGGQPGRQASSLIRGRPGTSASEGQ